MFIFLFHITRASPFVRAFIGQTLLNTDRQHQEKICHVEKHLQCLPPDRYTSYRYVLRFFGKFSKIVN